MAADAVSGTARDGASTMRVYDDAADHRPELPGDLPRKAGATHIGIFLAWCVERGLTSAALERARPEDFARLKRRWHTGRDFLLQFMDGRLTEADLGPAGRSFAESYYTTGQYLADYRATLLATRPSLYHVPDRWESLDALAPVLDERFEAWRHADASLAGAVSAATVVPTPEPRPTPEREPEPEPEPERAPEPEPTVPAALAPPPPRIQVEAAPPRMRIEVPPTARREAARATQQPPGRQPARPATGSRAPAPEGRPSRKRRPLPPALFQAPHRTVKAWKRPTKSGGWIIILVLALFYGFTKCSASRPKRRAARTRGEIERELRRQMERHIERARGTRGR